MPSRERSFHETTCRSPGRADDAVFMRLRPGETRPGFPGRDPAAPPPEPTEEELAAQEIDDLLASLTTEEKVGQLFFVRCPADSAAEDVAAYHLGGYLLFGRDYQDTGGAWLTKEQFTDTVQSYQDAAMADTGIPLLIGVDEEGGTVTRASRDPNLFDAPFPSPQALAKEQGETDYTQRLCRRRLGEKQRAAGPGHQCEPGPGGGCVHRPRRFHL